jgi:hypothetical protein
VGSHLDAGWNKKPRKGKKGRKGGDDQGEDEDEGEGEGESMDICTTLATSSTT